MKKILVGVLAILCFVVLVACDNQRKDETYIQKDLVQGTESVTEQATSIKELTESVTEKSTSIKELTENVTELATKNEMDNLNDNNGNKIYISVNGKQFEVELYDNETADSFKKFIPCELTMSELNGNEIYTELSMKLPSNPSVTEKIKKGDIMLFGDSCIVVFYDSFQTSYEYTPIGYLKDTDNLENYIISDNMVSFSS